MADIRITDLVDPKAIEDLKTVQQEMRAAHTVYLEVVRAVAQGIKIKVETTGDLDKLNGLIAQEAKKAEVATVQLNHAVQQQQQIIAQTTPEISRQLSAIQAENKAKRESYEIDQAAVQVARGVLGSRDNNLRQLARLKRETAELKEEQKALEKSFKDGTISESDYIGRSAELAGRQNQLKVATQDLQQTLNNQTKQMEANGGSYQQLSLQLEEMKKAYKSLTPEEKESSDAAKKLADEINRLDAHLKDAAGDMGEFQRNTGNYAIAANKYVDVMFRAVGLNGTFGNSLKELAASGTGNFVADLTVKLRAFGATLGTLLANPYVLAILGLAGTAMAVKWWYEYNKGLMQATRLTREFLDVHGERLVGIRSEIQAIADEYGKDYKEVLQAVDTLTHQWGITAEEALRSVRDGFQAGADENGRFLGQIQQYAPIFKDMKAEASQMVAVLAQTRSGIFNEKGLNMMQMALTRLRQMSKGAHDALDGIGIKTDEWLGKLAKGETNYLEFLRAISAKLAETNDQTTAYGAVLKEVFGRNGAAGGTDLVKYFADMTTEIEKVKAVTGEVGRLRDEHIEKQKQLNEAVAGLFDLTDDGFEEMTLKGKNYITDVLIGIVKWVGDIVDWFKEWYSQSVVLRTAINYIGFAFQTTWNMVKRFVELSTEAFKGLGSVLFSIFDFDTLFSSPSEWADKLGGAVKSTLSGLKGAVAGFAQDTESAFNDMYDRIANPPQFKKKAGSSAASGKDGDEEVVPLLTPTVDDGSDSNSKTKKQQEDVRKIILESARETINQKLSIVKKGSEEELSLQKDLAEAEYQLTLLNARKSYDDRAKKLAEALKFGMMTQQEYHDGLVKLTEERTQTELSAEKLKLQAIEDAQKAYSEAQIELVNERYSKEQEMSDARLVMGLAQLKERYAAGLISKEQYESMSAALSEQYAVLTAQAAISRIEEQLAVEELSDEQREQLTRQLYSARANLAKEAADAEIAELERTAAADKKTAQERQKNMQKWLQMASKAIGSVSNLVTQLYQNEIDSLEEQGEVVQEHYDKEVEHITQLEETGAISKEEAENRKAMAAQRREQKEEELERKKAELMYKQAIWEKMTAVAQAGIQTALGVTSALAMFPPNIPLAAVVGAMGAVEVATILATPIKAYAKGTPKGGHAGGLAVVGDGGREEVVSYRGMAWLTPDTPTLVNLPKGAEVFPEVDEVDFRHLLPMYRDGSAMVSRDAERPVIVNNDYRRLEQQMEKNNHLLMMAIRSERELAYRQAFRNYYQNR